MKRPAAVAPDDAVDRAVGKVHAAALEKTAEVEGASHGLKMEWKNVHSRSWHKAHRDAIEEGKTKEEATLLAKVAALCAKKKYFASGA